MKDFALNVLSLEGERNVEIGLRTTSELAAVLVFFNVQPGAAAD
jgi:hypothetical protein